MILRLLGTILEIWRYPISSLGGEKLTSVAIGREGISGDRVWCIADLQTGTPAAPEKEPRWRPALFLFSRLVSDLPEIGFPDHTWLSVGCREIPARLSDHFGFPVTVRPYGKAGKWPLNFGPPAINRYQPSPLHVLTTTSLDHLSALIGETAVNSRRFRPTILIATSGEPAFMEKSLFLEKAWIGKRVRIGEVIARAQEETQRCGMTLIAQPGIDENPDILRMILRQNRRNLGIYCSVETPGYASVGDQVLLIDD